MNRSNAERGVSPVVGVILLVALVVIMAAVVGAFVLDLGGNLSSPNTGSSVQFNEHAAGLSVTAMTVDNPLEVQYNGIAIGNLTSVGQSIAIPAAPGERVTIIEQRPDGKNVVVTAKEVEHSQALLGHWTFDAGSGTTAHDNSGLGNDGWLDGATWETNGVQGNAVHLDGSSEVYVDMGVMPNAQMTVSFWMRPVEDQQKTFAHPFGLGGGHLYTSYIRSTDGGGSIERVSYKTYPGDTRTEGTIKSVSAGEWQHVAMAYDGTEVSVYHNGTLMRTDSVSGPIDFETSMAVIGNSYGDNGGNYYIGDIDEFRLYNTGLNTSEVESIYQTEKP